MKQRSKKILAASLILFIFGSVLGAVGFFGGAKLAVGIGKGGLYLPDTGERSLQTETIPLESFRSMELDLAYTDLEFMESDEFAVKMSYYEKPEYGVEDGVLRVGSRLKGSWLLDLSFLKPAEEQNQRITVCYPAGTNFERVKLVIDYGDAALNSLNGENLTVDASFSDLLLRNLKLREMELSLSYGSVSGRGVTADVLTVNEDYNSFHLRESEFGRAVLEGSYGEFSLEDSQSREGFELRLDYADFLFSGLLSGETRADAAYSDLEIEAKNADSLGYDIDMSFGEAEILERSFDGKAFKEGTGGSISVRADFSDFSLEEYERDD